MPDSLIDNLTGLLPAHRALLEPSPLPGKVGEDPSLGLFLTTDDDRRVRLHSGRDPMREADQWLDALPGVTAADVVVLLGAGGGHIVDRLEVRKPTAVVVVLEPFAAAARAWLSRRDWRERLNSGRLHVLIGPQYDAPPPVMRLLADDARSTVFVHPVLGREAGAEIDAARRALVRLRFEGRANADAERRFAAPYLANTLRNLPVLAGSHDVATLFGSYRDTPALIVAAGPSLDANAGWLARARDHALLVAVDTALLPLLRHGIEPDLVVAVDPGDANARHFAHIPALAHAALVAEASVHPSSFRPFGSRVHTFRVGNSHPWPFLRAHGAERGQLTVWGSVLTAACDLALRMGCGPLVFAAANLAYTGGQPYARGTAYEADWVRGLVSGRALAEIWSGHVPDTAIELVDIAGRPTTSTPILQAFRDWLADTARTSGTRFINATGAGVLLGEAIEQMSGDAVVRFLAGRGGRFDASRAVDRRARADLAVLRRALDEVLAGLERGDGEGGPSPEHALTPADVAREWLATVERGGQGQDIAGILRRALVDIGDPTAPASDLPVPAFDAVPVVGAARALAALVAQPQLARRDPSPSEERLFGLIAPWSLFEWDETARPSLARFERAMAHAWLDLPWLSAPPTAPDRAIRHSMNTVPVVDDLPATALRREAECRDDVARLVLSHEWLLAARLSAPASRDVTDARAWGELAATVMDEARLRVADGDAPEGGREARLVRVAVDLDVAAPLGPFVGSIDRLAARFTGLLAPAPAGAASPRLDPPAPAERFFDEPVHYLRPRCLTAEGVPRAVIGATLNQYAALFAVMDSPYPVRIRRDGSHDLDRPWPRPLRGLQVLDGNGAAVAWHPDGRYVMVREHVDADTIVQDVSFQPAACAVDAGGEIWWAGKSGHLWRGRPGTLGDAPTFETPPVLSLHDDGAGGLLLDPVRRAPSGAPVRTRRGTGLHVPLGSRVAAEWALPRAGSRGLVSAGSAWTATPYPYADLLRLTHRDSGVSVELLCYYPMAAAWAGRSLIVSTGGADLWLFPDLQSALHRHLARTTAASVNDD